MNLKLDLHRHLGGCITPGFVWNAINNNGWHHIAKDEEHVRQLMQFQESEPAGFHRFLSKFTILDNVIWDEELIDRSVLDVCNGLSEESIDYTWLRFSINKYMRDLKWSKKQAIKFIRERFDYHLPGKVGLVLSLKYESDRECQKNLSSLINDPEVADAVIGIDLVGDEGCFCHKFYTPLFDEWNRANKITCAHVGESQQCENIKLAIEMGVKQIAHGVRAFDDEEVVKLAKDKDVGFDMALTSNLLTGVYDSIYSHPLDRFLHAGLRVTIGTDDPTQCGTTLDSEFQVLRNHGYRDEHLNQLKENAVNSYLRYK